VDVFLEAVDEKNLYGTVLYNGKNIVLELLRQGLARLVDWTAKATKNYEELKKAEEYETFV
jgi:endonuclease YncB( thermonuclease family)